MADPVEPDSRATQGTTTQRSRTHGSRTAPLWLRAALACSVVAILIWQIQHYTPFFSDDGFISLRYSQRLLDGQGLTWTDGERVEGYSNLSYVLLCAGIGALLQDLVLAARCVGFLGVGLMAWALWVNTGKGRLKVSTLISWNLLMSIAAVTIWAIGGLEATLYAGAILLGYAQHFDAPPDTHPGLGAAAKRSWPLALACLTRPDGPIFVVVLVASELVAGGVALKTLRSAFLTAFWPFVAFCGQMAFRLLYYGDWVPNTAHIKANTDVDRAMHGLEYLQAAFANAGMLVVFALGAWLLLRKTKYQRAIATALAAAILWSGYIASVGGDIFPAWRHALISYALLLFCGSFALRELFCPKSQPWVKSPKQYYAATLVALCTVVALAQSQHTDPGNERAVSERWEWDAASLGPLYRRFKPRAPLLAVEPAGALPYFSQLASVDMYGLCDAHISHQEPDEKQRLAHEYGDGEYIWARKPDLIVFSLPTGGNPRSSSGSVMTRKPGFKDLYKEVQFKAIDPVGTKGKMQVRRDGKAGIRRGPNSMFIPGYLLNSRSMVGYPIGDHEVGALLEASGTARSDVISLAPGVWKLEIMLTNAPHALTLSNKADTPLHWQAAPKGWLLENAGRIELEITAPSSQSLSFLGISLIKVNDTLNPETKKVAKANTKTILAAAPPKLARLPVAALASPRHFVYKGEEMSNGEIKVRPECGQQLPGVNQEIRLDTYEMADKDEWTGTLKGPIYRLPRNAIAYACISGGSYNAGLRLRSLDTGKVIASWSAFNSSRLKIVRENLSDYANATVQFEAYDTRTNAWGHVRVFGLGIVAPP